MAELENSKRSIERATYTPLKVVRREPTSGRAVHKWSYFAGLAATPAQVAQIVRQLSAGTDPVPQEQRAFLDTLIAASTESETHAASPPLKFLPAFAAIPAKLLLRFGEALLQLRQQLVARTVQSHIEILNRYDLEIRKSSGALPTKPTIPKRYTLDPSIVIPGIPGARIFRYDETLERTNAGSRRGAGARAQPAGTVKIGGRGGGIVVPPASEATDPPVSATTTPVALGGLMRWAIDHKVAADRAAQSLELAERLGMDLSVLTLPEYKQAAISLVNVTRDLNHAFAENIQVEPIGLLHLEKMSFVPAGIERGELRYSVPLSPGEVVNISHKEWSNTSEEFEQIVTDFLEAFSEQGVTEKNELSKSTTTQQQHSSGFSLGVTASGGWGPVSISTTLGVNVNDSSSKSEEVSRKQSSELTRKASSRSKQEHKVSFKVASASGTEDQAVRLIKNPFQDRTTRVDYYQLVRKWRVDLYRYGMRMTYDLTIPEPGSDILSRIAEINSLSAALEEGFGTTNSTLPWARFDLTPQQVTRGNYPALAAQYGVAVEPPPPEQIVLTRAFSKTTPEFDASKYAEYTTFEVDVPEGYQVTSWQAPWEAWAWEGETYFFAIHPDLNSWLGASGHLMMSVGTHFIQAFDIQLKLWLGLQPSAYGAWKLRAWGTLREAAQARYELNRTMLKDRLAKLQDELGAQDALSLRQIEREEVMKHILRWLFGPDFTFVPPGMPEDLYGPNQSVIDEVTWAQVLSRGEVIKFLHQAIEWENMVFFLYPYFWSHTARWELKKYLDHPDFLHRTFLKSGSARVVLTIRPGFERDFVTFVETGGFDPLPDSHPYMTIAAETEAFAHTNYPGIRAANPVENARPLLSPLQQKAWKEMQGVIALLEQFRTTNSAYPSTAQGLAALSGIGTVPVADPWGNAYQYKSPGAYTDFELWSNGSDGQPGGDGEAADITSWAEVSLIGRWYEYTPTSALDIAFDETLPGA